MIVKPLKFQQEIVQAINSPGYDEIIVSLPRGNGKSTLIADLMERRIRPDCPEFEPGKQHIVISASFEQSEQISTPLVAALDELPSRSDYLVRITSRSGRIVHKPTKTSIVIKSSSGRGIMGYGQNTGLVAVDECGSFHETNFGLMVSAIRTSIAKPDNKMAVVYASTIAPANPNSQWARMVADGTDRKARRWVKCIQGNAKTWDKWNTIKRANPLMWQFPESKKQLLLRRNEALVDPVTKQEFMMYRLNLPTAALTEMVLDIEDYERCLLLEHRYPEGEIISVGIDLGFSRSWSCATAIWENGYTSGFAMTPGDPDLAAQEKRDRVSPGTYLRLQENGSLVVCSGRRFVPVEEFLEQIYERWLGKGLLTLVGDYHRKEELIDLVARDYAAILEPRKTRWSEFTNDLTNLRNLIKADRLFIDPDFRGLLTASLSVARLELSGENSRLIKRPDNAGRDDVVASLLMAAGHFCREERQPVADPMNFVVL